MVFRERYGTAIGFCCDRNLEGVMSVSTDCHIRNLPKRLPAGTVYVVEGCGGHHGKLRVSSRYIVMPSGQRVEIAAELGRTQTVQAHLRRPFGTPRRSGSRSNSFLTQAKKIGLVAGTRSRKQR
jgi:hypothetical protein